MAFYYIGCVVMVLGLAGLFFLVRLAIKLFRYLNKDQ
jgi:hypothetical protein